MLGTKQFIRQSLELNLFFMRIMKEHAFFLEAGFTPKNSDLAKKADNFRKEFTELLERAISLSNGVISPMVKQSGELVTKFTLAAEKATTFYTEINLNTNVTEAEKNIIPAHGCDFSKCIEDSVIDLNNRTLRALEELINFKSHILEDVLHCNIFTFNYPLLIDHVRREAIFYHKLLCQLQNRVEIDMVCESIEQQRFWNRIMAEHAKFIRGLLDPTEEVLIKTAYNFGKEFDILEAQAIELNDSICNITREDLIATRDIRNFKAQATEGLLSCDIRSIIVPLLGDHTLREANHYLRLLKIFEKDCDSKDV